MDISPYFAEMITQKDQVIVPGLGKFFKRRSEGYYDEETKTFYPPTGKIDFSTEYMHDDKLVQHISQKSGISLTSAYAALDEYVRDLKNILKGSPVALEGIGKLELVDEKIRLESIDNAELNKAFFGLPSIDIEAASFQGEDTAQYSLAQQALNTAVEDDEDFEDSHKKSNLVKILLLLFAVVILSVLIALYYIRPEIYQNFGQIFKKGNKIENKSADDKALKTADSIYNSKLSTEEKLKNMGFDIENVRDSTDVTVNSETINNNDGYRYEIIIGRYLRKQEALDRIKFLRENGIDAKLITDAPDNFVYKISGATLYNEKDADKELKRIHDDINPLAEKLRIKILNNKK